MEFLHEKPTNWEQIQLKNKQVILIKFQPLFALVIAHILSVNPKNVMIFEVWSLNILQLCI
jgi:hypothetical protein